MFNGYAASFGLLFAFVLAPESALAQAPPRSLARITAFEKADDLALTWEGDQKIRVTVSRQRGLFQAPIRVQVNERSVSLGGFYVHVNRLTNGFAVERTEARLEGDRIEVKQFLRHPRLNVPTRLSLSLWMEPQDCGLRARVRVEGENQHLDRLGVGDHEGAGLEAQRMFFGRMYVLDQPQAFEHEHNYNTCRFWCWTMANGLTELQATAGPAKGFRFDPNKGRYDLYTYCESPIDYVFFISGRKAAEVIAQYRDTIQLQAPPTLGQLPGRVGVMTAYPIAERYEDFLEEWTGRGARDFVWLSYHPTPGDRQKVEPFGAIYATYDLYLDYFAEGPRKAADWAPDRVQYRDNGKMVRGYWSSTWLLPDLYVNEATQRVMGVFGHEFNDDDGKPDFLPSKATRYSNLAITRAEVGPSGIYLDVHASKAPHHFFDSQGRHHGAREHMRGEKALFDFVRQYLGKVPIWSEGGGEDYAGLMDGGWFMDYRPPEELKIRAAKWQFFPFIDLVHRERLLNMSIYYPLDRYDTNMVNLAILFGRPQAVSGYYGSRQDDMGGRLQVYYLTKAFHGMLGLSRMERMTFHDDDIDRAIIDYSNGARVWVNRGGTDWAVGDFQLPPMGYLVRGPGGFLEYRARKDGNIADVVRSAEYDYFSCPKQVDFGPVITDGALAVTHLGTDRLVLAEVVKPGSIALRLGEVPGTAPAQRALKAWALLTGNRRIELTFPDLRQRPDPADRSKLGNRVELRPVEMRNTLRYEILLSPTDS